MLTALRTPTAANISQPTRSVSCSESSINSLALKGHTNSITSVCMCWKTNWPWHKICCHGWKQPAHTTSLRRELFISPSFLHDRGCRGMERQVGHSLYLVPALTTSSSSSVTFTAATPLLSSPRTVDHAACPLRYDVLHVPPNKCHWMMNRG